MPGYPAYTSHRVFSPHYASKEKYESILNTTDQSLSDILCHELSK